MFMINKTRERKRKRKKVKITVEELDCLYDIPNLRRRNSRGIPQIVEYHARQQKTPLLATMYPHKASN